MRLTELLFSFKGRIGRQYWWLTSLAVAAVAGMTSSLIELAAKVSGSGAIDPETQQFEPSAPFLLGIFAIALLNAWISYALSTKRLHDRNRFGWLLVWQVLLLLGALLLAMAGFLVPEDQRKACFVAAGGLGIAAIIYSFWLFIELGFLKGTMGPNGYGLDPLGASRADATL
jgi:uncharacterized membrane protein YhaH (DUF805 family)